MPPTVKKHPAAGKVLRYEGHDYTIMGYPDDGDERFTIFDRDDPRTPNGRVACNTADVKDSGEGWFYLPGRVGPPLAGDTHLGKQLSPAFPERLKNAVREHPDYLAGRDDLAAAAVAKASKVEWPVHVSDAKFAKLHVLRDPAKIAAAKAAAEKAEAEKQAAKAKRASPKEG